MSAPSPLIGVHSVSQHLEGDKATLVLRRSLRHPPERVWRALTDPDQLRQWYMAELKLEPRVGGKVELTFLPAAVSGSGRVVAWDPPRALEYEWDALGAPNEFLAGEHATVRWELSPVEGGTLLVLTHRNLTKRAAEIFQIGGPFFALRLEALLDGRALPTWEQRVHEARRYEFLGPDARAP